MKKFGIEAVPFQHPDLEKWRQALTGGVQYVHAPTNLLVTGAPDDLWLTPEGELIVVDYKATSTTKEITLDEEYRQSYKNQMEVYQWLLRKNGFRVSNRGYFLYCNGDARREKFEQQLNFDVTLLPYDGDDRWVEETLVKIKACLEQDDTPTPTEGCEFCAYWQAVKEHIENTNHLLPEKDEDIVYILKNPCMEGLVKIGRTTTTNFKKRLNELTGHSGVPLPFEKYYAAVVHDARFVESNLHKTFSIHRISPKREFFKLDPSHAQAALELAAIREFVVTTEAEDEEEIRQYEIKKPKFQFQFAKVPIYAVLNFVRDESITCRVVDEKTVEFEGEKTSLSTAAAKILNSRYGWGKNASVQGTIYWLYEGETLDERRQRLAATL